MFRASAAVMADMTISSVVAVHDGSVFDVIVAAKTQVI